MSNIIFPPACDGLGGGGTGRGGFYYDPDPVVLWKNYFPSRANPGDPLGKRGQATLFADTHLSDKELEEYQNDQMRMILLHYVDDSGTEVFEPANRIFYKQDGQATSHWYWVSAMGQSTAGMDLSLHSVTELRDGDHVVEAIAENHDNLTKITEAFHDGEVQIQDGKAVLDCEKVKEHFESKDGSISIQVDGPSGACKINLMDQGYLGVFETVAALQKYVTDNKLTPVNDKSWAYISKVHMGNIPVGDIPAVVMYNSEHVDKWHVATYAGDTLIVTLDAAGKPTRVDSATGIKKTDNITLGSDGLLTITGGKPTGQDIADVVTEDSPVLPYVVESGADTGKVKFNLDKENAHNPLATILAADDGIFYTQKGTESDIQANITTDEHGKKKIGFRINDQKLTITAEAVRNVIYRLKPGTQEEDPNNDLKFNITGGHLLDIVFNDDKLRNTTYKHLTEGADTNKTPLIQAGKGISLKTAQDVGKELHLEIHSTAFLGFFDSFSALKTEALKHPESMVQDVTFGYVRHKPYGTQEGPTSLKLAAQYEIWRWTKETPEGTPVTAADVNNENNWDNKQWISLDGFGITLVGSSTRYHDWTPNDETKAPLASNHLGQLIYYVTDNKWYWSDGTRWNQHAVGEVNYFRGFFNNSGELPTDNLVANRSYAYVMTAQGSGQAEPREIPQLWLFSQGGVGAAQWRQQFTKGALIATAGGQKDKSITSITVKQQGPAGAKISGKELQLTIPHTSVSANTLEELQTNYPAASHRGAFGLVNSYNPFEHIEGTPAIFTSDGTAWSLLTAKSPADAKTVEPNKWLGEQLLNYLLAYPKYNRPSSTDTTGGAYDFNCETFSNTVFVKAGDTTEAFANPSTDDTDGYILRTLVNEPGSGVPNATTSPIDAKWIQTLTGIKTGKQWRRVKQGNSHTRGEWVDVASGGVATELEFFDVSGTSVGKANKIKEGDGVTFVKNPTTGMMEIGIDEPEFDKDHLINIIDSDSEVTAETASSVNHVNLRLNQPKVVKRLVHSAGATPSILKDGEGIKISEIGTGKAIQVKVDVDKSVFVKGDSVTHEGLINDVAFAGGQLRIHSCPGSDKLQQYFEAGDNVTFEKGSVITDGTVSESDQHKLKINVTAPKTTINGQLSQGQPTPVSTLKLGTGMAGAIADGVMTINSTGGGDIPLSPMTVQGTDESSDPITIQNTDDMIFSPAFKLSSVQDHPTKVMLDLRHEGALLGVFETKGELFNAAALHKSDWAKGKVVGYVRSKSNATGSPLYMHEMWVWASTNKVPTPTDISQVQNWTVTYTPILGQSTLRVGAGSEIYTSWTPTNPTGLDAAHHRGQMVYYVQQAGSAYTHGDGYYHSNGTEWKLVIVDGSGTVNVSTDDEIDPEETSHVPLVEQIHNLKFDGVDGLHVSLSKEGEGHGENGIAKVTISGKDVANNIRIQGKNPQGDISELINFVEFDEDTFDVTKHTQSGGTTEYLKITNKAGASAGVQITGKKQDGSVLAKQVTKFKFDENIMLSETDSTGEDVGLFLKHRGNTVTQTVKDSAGTATTTSFEHIDTFDFKGAVKLDTNGAGTGTGSHAKLKIGMGVTQGDTSADNVTDFVFDGATVTLGSEDVDTGRRSATVSITADKVTADGINAILDPNGDVTGQVLARKLHLEMTQPKLASKLFGNTAEGVKDVLKAGVGISIEKSNDQITISGGGAITVEGFDTDDEADKEYTNVTTVDFGQSLTTKAGHGVKVVPRLQGGIKAGDAVPTMLPFKTIQVNGDSHSAILTADGGSLVIDSVRPIMEVETAGELEQKKDSSYEGRIAFAKSSHTFYYLPKPASGAAHKWETFAFHEMDQAVIDLQTRFPYSAVSNSSFIEDNHMCTGYVGISLKDAQDTLHIPIPEVGTLFTVYANDATSHDVKHQGHWLQTFYGMESGTEWKRHRNIKQNTAGGSTEYVWSDWHRAALLDESCYSTFMMDNDFTMQDLYISGSAASENRMVMPYCIHQDPTANIILVPNTTGTDVGKLRGKFQVRKEGLYDLNCISLPTWVDGKATSESVSYEAGAVFQLTSLTGDTSSDVISTTVKDVYDKANKRFNPAKVQFNKVKLHVGVTYEMQITLTNDTETERKALMYDPWKNLMSLDPHGSRTKTGENIINGLFRTMGGISFKQGNEVRIQPTSASDPTVRVFGEVYATEMKTGSKGE